MITLRQRRGALARPLLLLLFYYMALQRSSWGRSARSRSTHISFYLFTNGRIRVSSRGDLCGWAERKVNGCPPVSRSLGHIHFSKSFDCINQINLLELKVLGKINLKVGALSKKEGGGERERI